MQASLVVLFALFAVALSQVYVRPSNATQLTIGQTSGGYIAPQYDEDYGYIMSYSYVYIPENVYHFNITLNSGYLGVGDCYYGVSLYLRMDGYPCYGSDDSFGYNYVCSNIDSVGSAGYGDGAVTEDFYPGTVSRSSYGIESQFISGGYIYIGVRRGYEYDYNNTCAYSLLVQADYCAGNETNTIASSSDYDEAADTYCTTYANVNANNTVTYVNYFMNAGSMVYKYDAPANLGSINITINATYYFSVYGTTYQSYQSSAYSVCYDSADSVGDFYIVTLQCEAVYAGAFFINIEPSSGEQLNGSIVIKPLICYSGVGPNCNSPMIDLTNLTTVGYVRIPPLTDDQFAYGYLPLTTALIGQYQTISFGLQGTNSSYIYVGRNRYATNDNDDEYYESSNSNINDATFLSLSTNDVQLFNGQNPGIFWVSIECYYDSCSDIVLFGNFSGSNPIVGSTTNTVRSTTGMSSMNMTMTSGKMNNGTGLTSGANRVTSGVRATTAHMMTTSPRTTGVAAASSSNAAVVVASIVLSIIAVVLAC